MRSRSDDMLLFGRESAGVPEAVHAAAAGAAAHPDAAGPALAQCGDGGRHGGRRGAAADRRLPARGPGPQQEPDLRRSRIFPRYRGHIGATEPETSVAYAVKEIFLTLQGEGAQAGATGRVLPVRRLQSVVRAGRPTAPPRLPILRYRLSSAPTARAAAPMRAARALADAIAAEWGGGRRAPLSSCRHRRRAAAADRRRAARRAACARL